MKEEHGESGHDALNNEGDMETSEVTRREFTLGGLELR